MGLEEVLEEVVVEEVLGEVVVEEVMEEVVLGEVEGVMELGVGVVVEYLELLEMLGVKKELKR